MLRQLFCLGTVVKPVYGVQGLLVKMITGDQALIGRETAKQLGMGTNIFNTEVLLKVMPVAYLSFAAPSHWHLALCRSAGYLVLITSCYKSCFYSILCNAVRTDIYSCRQICHQCSASSMSKACMLLHTGKGGQGCARRFQKC